MNGYKGKSILPGIFFSLGLNWASATCYKIPAKKVKVRFRGGGGKG